MPLDEILRIGDRVEFRVDPERRYWTNTYDDVPDGTIGVVCGFYDAVLYEPRVPVRGFEPGVYHEKGAVSVWLPDGRILPGDYSISMVDKIEERMRIEAMRNENGLIRSTRVRLGELPETKFWEYDRVCVAFPGGAPLEMTIRQVDYHSMHKKCVDGSPHPFYQVVYEGGATTSAKEEWISLIERGNIWNYYHDLPLVFADIQEEANFLVMIGQTEELKNPLNGLYNWTREEVIEAIRDGYAHGFSLSDGFFGTGYHAGAIRYRDETFGQRMAEATLAMAEKRAS